MSANLALDPQLPLHLLGSCLHRRRCISMRTGFGFLGLYLQTLDYQVGGLSDRARRCSLYAVPGFSPAPIRCTTPGCKP
jgi:hypothetical protein